MRVLVSGGGGFLGSALCGVLSDRGDDVVCVDDWSTGSPENVEHLRDRPGFTLVECDVIDEAALAAAGIGGPIDAVAHLASPASPPDYHRLPLQTLAVGSRGTENLLKIAHQHGARFLLASTSEIYGDPQVHPQTEDYFGNVNSIGPRSVYDEAKRYAEAVSAAYRRTYDVNVGIVRIFNTYGPRMRAHDGRVVSSFIVQALSGSPLTIYGDGTQTRSFCYVDDLVRGLVAMLDSTEPGPVNLGNPGEYTMLELAEEVLRTTGSDSKIEYYPLPTDDPTRRKPAIGRAQHSLGWEPRIPLAEGLQRTVEYFAGRPTEVASAAIKIAGGAEPVSVAG